MTDNGLTPQALATACNCIAGDIDERRWQLARLAQKARDEGIEHYAEIMANVANVRRKPRTIKEWAHVADFADSLPRMFVLTFSHYGRAARYQDRLPMDTILEALDEAEAEGIDVDGLSVHLSSLCQELPDPFHMGDWLSAELERIRKAIAGAETDADIEALQRLEAAVDRERSRLIK